jgi:hypothetical protein
MKGIQNIKGTQKTKPAGMNPAGFVAAFFVTTDKVKLQKV